MKISKLFHWLYAFLMLLPVFFIVGRCLYVTFNKNAKDSYYGETINETRVLSANNDYTFGERYTLTIGNLPNVNQPEIVLNVSDVSSSTITGISNTNTIYIRTNSNNNTYVFFYNGSTYLTDRLLSATATHTIEFVYLSSNNTNTLVNDYKDIITYVEHNKYSYLDNAFIYSVNSLNDTPLFSWAKTSFLVAPFTYISGLFGIESTSPINTMLSYWLAISIIWLVFDIIMYVPLLVHRWIDKAKLE